jgi:diguanylate cyclase (GGDEF)-like protein/PAS domain S-box-containing protein
MKALDLDYRGLFDASPNPYLVLDRALNIVGANKAYLAATRRELADIVGRWAWDAFPTDPETLKRAIASFERVIQTGQPDTIALLRYDIPRPESEGGGFAVRYWSITHSPVLNAAGEVAWVLQHPIDVTELQELREAAQASATGADARLGPVVSGIVERAQNVHEANLALKDEMEARQHAEQQVKASEEKYRTLFANMAEGFALCRLVYDAQGLPIDLVVIEANAAFHRQTGLPENLIGRPAKEILPHLEQHWLEAYDAVVKTGQSQHLENVSADTQRTYDVTAFRPRPGYFAVVFRDITEIKRTQDALLDSEQRYKALFNNRTSAVAHLRVVADGHGNPVDYYFDAVNDAWQRLMGRRREDVVGRRGTEVFPGLREQEWDPVEHLGRIALEGGEDVFDIHFRPNRQWVSIHAYSPKRGECTVIFHDITPQKEAEFSLQDSERRLALALSASGSAVWEMDVATRIIKGEDKLYEMIGYARGELETLDDWFGLVHPEDGSGVAELVAETIAGKREQYGFEVRVRTKTGAWRWNLTQAIAAERNDAGHALRLVGTHTDITERKLAEQRIRDVALHDPLTGLPNRALVFEYGGHLLAGAHRTHVHGALLFIDLDRFKPINDIYGHQTGDRVLQEVAQRLAACTRHEDLIGRLGGDEFVILLPRLDIDRRRAATVAQHVVRSISQPFLVDALELSLSPSIGISYYPEHGADIGDLLHAADLAMYQAKRSGRANYHFYSPELDRKADEIYSLEARLKEAIKHGRLALHYQPVVDIANGRLIGAEALVRLVDDGKRVGPANFIPVAESAGLIGEIGQWVVREACRQHEIWRGEGLRIPIAINVSPLQFRQRNFADLLKSILADTGVDPTCLQLEVTESTIMDALEEAVDILDHIKALGVKVALDDFGTGYSSLSRLANLPLDTLKVDQSFVRGIECDQVSKAVTEAIITLGRRLRLDVIGEGIESADELRCLQDYGCNQAQGYWFSEPLPASQFAHWHRRQRLH